MKTTQHPFQICLVLALLFLFSLPAALQAQFIFTTNNGTITITGYSGPGGAATIPSTLGGLPVTSIGNDAFTNCSFTSVIIPNGVTNIGSFAFYDCTSLTNVTISTNDFIIGQAAFYGCSSLRGVTIPSSVTSIGSGAFTYCNLAAVSIPNSVTNIGGFAFYGCTNLTSVVFGVNVASIGQAAFYQCSRLRNVTIPSKVTDIAGSVFEFCYDLTNVVMGPNVTSIESGAFADSDLASVTIPDSVTNISDSVFYGCTNLISVIIGANVTSIGQAAFYACSNLYGLYFKGDMPTNANIYAFLYDPKATAYYLPGTVGWSTNFDGLPTAFWTLPYPLILASRTGFGVQTNQFGFNISWATNKSVIVEACTNLFKPVWQPVHTNTLTAGLSYFGDPKWTNYPDRFYRIYSP